MLSCYVYIELGFVIMCPNYRCMKVTFLPSKQKILDLFSPLVNLSTKPSEIFLARFFVFLSSPYLTRLKIQKYFQLFRIAKLTLQMYLCSSTMMSFLSSKRFQWIDEPLSQYFIPHYDNDSLSLIFILFITRTYDSDKNFSRTKTEYLNTPEYIEWILSSGI